MEQKGTFLKGGGEQGQMLGAQPGNEASGFGNEVAVGDLKWNHSGREMSQTTKGTDGRAARGQTLCRFREGTGCSWRARARL